MLSAPQGTVTVRVYGSGAEVCEENDLNSADAAKVYQKNAYTFHAQILKCLFFHH